MTKVISAILLLLALNSYAQKFAIIENKGENAKYFDYNDPCSFIGVLRNNMFVIPDMVALNNFQGVYDERMLNELGVEKSSMLEFYIAPILSIYRPVSEDTLVIIKTNQSINAYLDSLKNDNDYEMLFSIDKNKLEKYWDSATEGGFVRIQINYFFDIRNISALLLEKKGIVTWVHFIKSMPNGKSFISLSLTKDQLMETECFVFWEKLDAITSEKIKSTYKGSLTDQVNSQDFIDWKMGSPMYLNEIDTVINFHHTGCSDIISSQSQNKPFSDFSNQHIYNSSSFFIENLEEIKYEQDFGPRLKIFRPISEDEYEIVKTQQTFEMYFDSLISDSDYEELLNFDRNEFKRWWEVTPTNEIVRQTKLTLTLWKDAPGSRVAVGYKVFDQGQYIRIMDLIFFSEIDSEIIPIFQISYPFDSDNVITDVLGNFQVDTKVCKSWNRLLDIKTRKIKYSSIQESLNLVNKSTQF